jgi:hypothetical protein
LRRSRSASGGEAGFTPHFYYRRTRRRLSL